MHVKELRNRETLLADVTARQLRAFVTVGKALSYTAAADELHLTEPGVYAQVKRLEAQLGCRLLERSGRGLRLTNEGTLLLPLSRSALAEIERMEHAIQRIARAHRIVVSAGSVTGSYILPSLIRAFALEQPEVVVDLRPGPTAEVIQAVAQGTADIGIGAGLDRYPLPPNVSLAAWVEEEHVLLVSSTLSPSPDVPAVIYEMPHSAGLTSIRRRRLEQMGFVEYEFRSLPSADAVKGACAAGLGYALMPRRAALLEIQAGVMHEVQGFADTQQIWICLTAAAKLAPDVQRFFRFLQDNVPPGEPRAHLNGALPSSTALMR